MIDRPKTSPTRKVVYYSILLFFTVIFTLILGEIAARGLKLLGPSTLLFRQFDSITGVSLIPNVSGVHRKCYDGFVSINHHGMRDRARSLEKDPGVFRIGLFSDSLIEAVHVKPEETATALLESLLNERRICNDACEVLNFSVGGFATLQNYLRYTNLGSQFDLDLVILVFTDNDLPILTEDREKSEKNKDSPKQIHVVGNLYPTPVLISAGDDPVIQYPAKPPYTDEMSLLFKHSTLAYFLYKSYNALFSSHDWPIRQVTPDWAKNRPNALFLDPDNPIATNAWNYTESVLDMFVSETEKRGSKFMIVHWGYDEGSNPWYKPLGAGERPRNFDPDYASHWFSDYGRTKNIHVYNLSEDISRYVTENKLDKPYLSFECDMHFNPVGQRLIADSLYKNLIENQVIPENHSVSQHQ